MFDVQKRELKARGWFENFKKRNKINSVTMQKEVANSDLEVAEKFERSLKRFMNNEGYTLHQVLICENTSFF